MQRPPQIAPVDVNKLVLTGKHTVDLRHCPAKIAHKYTGSEIIKLKAISTNYRKPPPKDHE